MASLGELSFALGLDSKKFDDAIKIAKKKIAELGTDVSINVNVDAEKVAKQIQAELDKIQKSAGTGGTTNIKVELDDKSISNVKTQLAKLGEPIVTKIQVEYDAEKFQAVETAMKNFGKRVSESVNGGLSKGGQKQSTPTNSNQKKGIFERGMEYIFGDDDDTVLQSKVSGVDELSNAIGRLNTQLEEMNKQQEKRSKTVRSRTSSVSREEDSAKRELSQLRRLEEGVRRWENIKANISATKVDKDSSDYRKAIALIDEYISKLEEAKKSAGKFTDREMTEMLGQTLSGKAQEANRLIKNQKDLEKGLMADFTKQQAQIQRFEESIRRIQNVKAKLGASDVDKNSSNYRQAIAILDDYIDKLESAKKKAGDYTKRQMAGMTGQTLSGEIAEAERLVQAERNLARQKEQASKNAIRKEKEEIALKKAKVQLSKEEQNLAKSKANADSAELKKQREKVKLKKEKLSYQKKLNRETKKGTSWASQLNNQITNAFSIYALERFIRNLYTIGGEFQKQQIALRNMIGEVSKADAVFERIKDLSVKSPFTFAELASYTKQMSAYGIEYKDIYDTTKRLADISAGVGVDMSRLILAFGQVRSAAVLRGQELRQFTEAGIPLVKELAKSFSELEGRIVSTGEVFTKISNREVSFDMVKDILMDMTDPGGRFFETQEKLAESLAGKWSNLKDAWDIMMADIANNTSGTLNVLADTITYLVRNWDSWSRVIISVAGAIGLLNAALKVQAMLVNSNPWMWLAAGIGIAAGSVWQYAHNTRDAVNAVSDLNKELEKSKAELEDNLSKANRYLDTLSKSTDNEEEKEVLLKKQKETFNELVKLYPDILRGEDLELMTLEKIADKRKEIADYTKESILGKYDTLIKDTYNEYVSKKRNAENIAREAGLTLDDFPETKRELQELYNMYTDAMNAKEMYEQGLLDAAKPKPLADWQKIAKDLTDKYKEQKIFFKDPTAEHDIYSYFEHLSDVFKDAKDKYDNTVDKSLRNPQKSIMNAADTINKAIGGRTFYYKQNSKDAKEQASIDAKAYYEELKRKLSEEAQKWNLYKQLFDVTGNKKLSMRIAFDDSMTFVSPFMESLKEQLKKEAAKHGVTISVEDLLGMGEKQLMAETSIPEAIREKVAKGLGAIIEAYHSENKRLKNETIKDYIEIIKASKDFAAQIADVERDLAKQLETLASIHGKGTPEYERAAAEAIKRAEEKKVGIEFEQFKESSDWVKVFDDLDRVSNATLDSMIKNVEEFARRTNLGVKETKELVEALGKLRDESIERNPFKGFKDAWNRKKYLKSGVLTESGMVRFGSGTQNDPYTFKNKKDVDNGIAEANEDLKNSSLAVADKFQAVANAADLLSGLFENLGIDLGGVSDLFGGIAGGAQSGAGIASAFNLGGPWGAIAGAAVGMLSSVFAMHDKALQKEIEASEARTELIENISKNLEETLERNLGGIYTTGIDKATRENLKSYIKDYELWKNVPNPFNKGVTSKESYDKAYEALNQDSYYDAQLANLMLERDELKHRKELEADKKKADKAKLADYEQELVELESSIKNFALDMANTLYGIDFKDWAGQLAESLVSAWASGEDAVQAYKDTVNNILRDLGVSVISQKIIEPLLQSTMDDFLAQFEKDNGKLTESSMSILAGMANGAEEAAKVTEAYFEGLKKLGIDLSESSDEAKDSLSKGVQGVTEDTANLLGSYLQAIRQDVSVKRSLVEKLIGEDVPKMNYIAEAQLRELSQIQANTLRNANAADKIYELVNRVVDKGSNKLKV